MNMNMNGQGVAHAWHRRRVACSAAPSLAASILSIKANRPLNISAAVIGRDEASLLLAPDRSSGRMAS